LNSLAGYPAEITEDQPSSGIPENLPH